MSGSAHQIKKGLQASLVKSAAPICSSFILILTSQYCLHRFALTMFCCVLTLFSVLFLSLRILILCFISEAQGHSIKIFPPPSLYCFEWGAVVWDPVEDCHSLAKWNKCNWLLRPQHRFSLIYIWPNVQNKVSVGEPWGLTSSDELPGLQTQQIMIFKFLKKYNISAQAKYTLCVVNKIYKMLCMVVCACNSSKCGVGQKE